VSLGLRLLGCTAAACLPTAALLMTTRPPDSVGWGAYIVVITWTAAFLAAWICWPPE
jgi:hypothetical protein